MKRQEYKEFMEAQKGINGGYTIYPSKYYATKVKKENEVVVRVSCGYICMTYNEYYNNYYRKMLLFKRIANELNKRS